MPTISHGDTPDSASPRSRRESDGRERNASRLKSRASGHQQHLELIEGELISKMGKKRPHTNAMVIMHAWLLRVFGEQYVNQEASIDVAPVDNPDQ